MGVRERERERESARTRKRIEGEGGRDGRMIGGRESDGGDDVVGSGGSRHSFTGGPD